MVQALAFPKPRPASSPWRRVSRGRGSGRHRAGQIEALRPLVALVRTVVPAPGALGRDSYWIADRGTIRPIWLMRHYGPWSWAAKLWPSCMGGGPFPKFCRGGPCICEGPVGAITADSVEIPNLNMLEIISFRSFASNSVQSSSIWNKAKQTSPFKNENQVIKFKHYHSARLESCQLTSFPSRSHHHRRFTIGHWCFI